MGESGWLQLRKLNQIISICILLLCFSSTVKATAAPNIVLIVADYMGYSDIEPYGAKDIRTPSLSTIARQGVQFNSHYSSAPKCIPARASLMSGLYPRKAFKKGRGFVAESNTVLKGLKDANYRTALIGKWHLGLSEGRHPNDHGFDYFLGYNSWTLSRHSHQTSDGENGLYENKVPIERAAYLSDLFSKAAQEFVAAKSERPFFLYLSYSAGLPPYQGPDLAPEHWGSGWDATEAKRSEYVAMIERMDQGIAKVMQQLDQQGLSNNTLLIFTYDHGGRHLANSGPLFHGFDTLWEGGIRVPLLMRWPNKLEAGKKVNEPSIIMDISASILDAAGQHKLIESADGKSLLLKDRESFSDRAIFWKNKSMKAARKGRWKYLQDGYTQFLFDVSTDPGERNNLFYSRQSKLKELSELWDVWEQSQLSD